MCVAESAAAACTMFEQIHPTWVPQDMGLPNTSGLVLAELALLS